MVKTDLPRLTPSVIDDAEAFDAWLDAARDTGAVAFIDKPEDWTSFDCVAKIRNMMQIKRVGHAGTLDPLATGLLIVCVGPATKQVEHYQAQDKEYDVVVKLGATTETDDRGSEETVVEVANVPSAEQIKEELNSFVGTITQVSPRYSAIKIKGRRQYELARKGKDFTPAPRIVDIHSFDVSDISWPYVTFRMTCSKGTYVRSIARDLGEKLGCGGYVHVLRRTAIGEHRVEDAVPLLTLIERMEARVTQ